MRKSPVRHKVREHKRRGRRVNSFWRGRGKILRKVIRKSKIFVMPVHTVDKRFSPFIQEKYDRDRRTVKHYLSNKSDVFVSVTDGEYTVKITRGSKVLFFKNDRMNEPVPAGDWLDLPEKHWNLTDAQYKALSVTERTKLEAKEQLTKWIRKEYYTLWLDAYKPKMYERMWLDEGLSAFTIKHGLAARDRKLKPLVLKIWRGKVA